MCKKNNIHNFLDKFMIVIQDKNFCEKLSHFLGQKYNYYFRSNTCVNMTKLLKAAQ